MGIDNSRIKNNMIEVWNKIDLLEEPLNYDQLMKNDIPIIPISALYETNCNQLV
jgi:50S ribosomal subunit-associated GTPase HflX